MNFKLKLSLVAAAAALLAAPAFAAGLDATTVVTADGVYELAVAELTTVALSTDGNVALIAQEGAGHIAYIDQSGTDGVNFAAIAQAAATTDVAAITQVGTANRASVFQR